MRTDVKYTLWRIHIVKDWYVRWKYSLFDEQFPPPEKNVLQLANGHTQDFMNVSCNWMRSLHWSVPSIKNDEFNTREEIKQHSLQREHESPHFLTAQKVTRDVWIYYFILIHFYIFSSGQCVCILNNSKTRAMNYPFFHIWISILKKMSQS